MVQSIDLYFLFLISVVMPSGTIPDGSGILYEVGGQFTCAGYQGNPLTCNGLNNYQQSESPSSDGFVKLALGYEHACGISANTDLVECWGRNDYGESTPPNDVKFVEIECGDFFTCGIERNTSSIACWGYNGSGGSTPPTGSYSALSLGHRYGCASDLDGNSLQCWGYDHDGQVSNAPTSMGFDRFSCGIFHACLIQSSNQRLHCWGQNDYRQATPPTDVLFIDVDPGLHHTCGITSTYDIHCFGRMSDYSDMPSGDFLSIKVYRSHTCALSLDSMMIRCFGENSFGESTDISVDTLSRENEILPTASPTHSPTTYPTPSPTQPPTTYPTNAPTPTTYVRLCEIPEYYSTDCTTILYGTICDLSFICASGTYSSPAARECTESGWVGPEPKICEARLCILPFMEPAGVKYGTLPTLTECSSTDCDNYILNDVECDPGYGLTMTKCTAERELVTLQCIQECIQYGDECIPPSSLFTLEIFENFYHGMNIENPYEPSSGYPIFTAVEHQNLGVDEWNRDLIESRSDESYRFLLENQFTKTYTGSSTTIDSTRQSYGSYGDFVHTSAMQVQQSADLTASMMEDDGETEHASIGVAGSQMKNRESGSQYSHTADFRASQFKRTLIFASYRFNPSDPNVQINTDLVEMLKNLEPYSDSTKIQYNAIFDTYGSHYPSTFDLGYEIKAAEFSRECENAGSNEESRAKEECFEGLFTYKMILGGNVERCKATSSASSSDTREYLTFESASFEVRGGSSDTTRQLADALASMQYDATTVYTDVYEDWVESTYVNPGIVGFAAHPLWYLVATHPALAEVSDRANDMEKAYYANLQVRENNFRKNWCGASCNCGYELDLKSCSCNVLQCFDTYDATDCCSQRPMLECTSKASGAGIPNVGLAILFVLFAFIL